MVETAVKETLEKRKTLTRDIGGGSKTSEVGDTISSKISKTLDERLEYMDQLKGVRLSHQDVSVKTRID